MALSNEDKKIKKFVMGFTKGVLGKGNSTDMCFAVCSPLSTLLNAMGISCILAEGEIFGNHHIWIALSDGRIIDPTADQFSLPNIYCENRPKHYRLTPRRKMFLSTSPPTNQP